MSLSTNNSNLMEGCTIDSHSTIYGCTILYTQAASLKLSLRTYTHRTTNYLTDSNGRHKRMECGTSLLPPEQYKLSVSQTYHFFSSTAMTTIFSEMTNCSRSNLFLLQFQVWSAYLLVRPSIYESTERCQRGCRPLISHIMCNFVTSQCTQVYARTRSPWNSVVIKRMCKQCVPGALSPPPLRLGTRLVIQYAHPSVAVHIFKGLHFHWPPQRTIK